MAGITDVGPREKCVSRLLVVIGNGVESGLTGNTATALMGLFRVRHVAIDGGGPCWWSDE